MNRQLLHTGLVAQDAALAAFAAGVDGQHGQLAAILFEYMEAEYINGRTLAGTRHATDAHSDGTS